MKGRSSSSKVSLEGLAFLEHLPDDVDYVIVHKDLFSEIEMHPPLKLPPALLRWMPETWHLQLLISSKMGAPLYEDDMLAVYPGPRSWHAPAARIDLTRRPITLPPTSGLQEPEKPPSQRDAEGPPHRQNILQQSPRSGPAGEPE